MSVEFKPGRYFVCLFSLPVPKGHPLLTTGGDVFGALYTDDPAGGQATSWTMLCRLRVHLDQQVWESKDTRKWWEVKMSNKDKKEALAATKRWLETLAAASLSKSGPDFYMLDCDGAEAIDRMAENPPHWMHRQESYAE
jgi:hypothetical protein